jgi:hypothetical protein
MDPITAFAAAQAALGMIRKGVDFYKECKATANDVSDITAEVSGHIGKFLDAKNIVQEAAEKAKQESEDPDITDNLNSRALNNVMLQVQLEAAERALREMLIYESPGLGAIWSRFEKERQRLNELRKKKQEAAEQRRQDELQEARLRADRRRAKARKLWDEAQWVIIALSMVIFYGGCMYLIYKDRVEQSPELGTCFIPRGSPGYETWSNLRWINCTK